MIYEGLLKPSFRYDGYRGSYCHDGIPLLQLLQLNSYSRSQYPVQTLHYSFHDSRTLLKVVGTDSLVYLWSLVSA